MLLPLMLISLTVAPPTSDGSTANGTFTVGMVYVMHPTTPPMLGTVASCVIAFVVAARVNT